MTGELGKVERARARRSKRDRRKAFGELTQRAAPPARRAHRAVRAHAAAPRGARRARRRAASGASAWPKTCCGSPGFLEGVNYRKQAHARRTPAVPTTRSCCPTACVMHMDVKFPLDNYVRYLEADNDVERTQFRDQFLRDVRDRVQGAHDARLPRRGRRDRRLPAAVHPERAGLRVRAGARPRDPRRRAAQQDRAVLAAHAVRGARGGAPGGRQLPARAHVERDPRRCSASSRCSGRSTSAQLDKVQQRFEQVGEGVRRAHDHPPPRAATPARQDRVAAPRGAGARSMPTSRRYALEAA